MEENNLDRAGSQKRYSDVPITGDNSIRAKICNVEKQRRYIEQLRTPEKKSDLLEYHRKRAARQRELRKKKKEAQSNNDSTNNCTEELKQQNEEYHEQEAQSNNKIHSSTQELKQ